MVVVSEQSLTETTAFQDRVLTSLDILRKLPDGLFRASNQWRKLKRQIKTRRSAPDSTTQSALLMSLVVLPSV